MTLQGQIEQNFGPVSLQVAGQYQKIKLDASQDYNSNVGDRSLYAQGLNTLAFFAANPIPLGVGPNGPPLSNAYFGPVAAANIPDGPNGQLCTDRKSTRLNSSH